MEHAFLSVEEFNQLLHQWNGQTIKVSKHELNDFDETLLELQDISYSTNTRRIDDYEAKHALQLNGSGSIITDTNDLQSLPSSLYEIPLEDNTLYEFDGSRFLVSTSRGVYKIELVNDQER
ncbi:hypothetical protein F3157_10845 [Virgibacillus dakarensis]|uniref:Uncharacterized protein n=1 Tax=Lentibacillus populi TaxID=1827502 RepID=A0A9W5TY35_9BACI|nr:MULTISPECIES: hypothetical protein [Bacillaceae]MTW86154.1 hypothetical protein [Virgibacillus dakarensis]GGB46549.1 hypothetical protein GCM10011409_25130 [Lentibacillus populi]